MFKNIFYEVGESSDVVSSITLFKIEKIKEILKKNNNLGGKSIPPDNILNDMLGFFQACVDFVDVVALNEEIVDDLLSIFGNSNYWVEIREYIKIEHSLDWSNTKLSKKLYESLCKMKYVVSLYIPLINLFSVLQNKIILINQYYNEKNIYKIYKYVCFLGIIFILSMIYYKKRMFSFLYFKNDVKGMGSSKMITDVKNVF